MKIFSLILFVGSAIAAPSFEVHHRNNRSIGSSLDKFLENVGLYNLLPWIEEMIQGDPDMLKFTEFFKSDKLKDIEEHVKECPGYQELKVEDVDVLKLIEIISKLFTGGSYHGNYYKIQPRRTLREVLAEIFDKLNFSLGVVHDCDKVCQENEKKFKDFIWGGPFNKMVACIRDNKNVKELEKMLNEDGVDVDGLIEMIKSLAGPDSHKD